MYCYLNAWISDEQIVLEKVKTNHIVYSKHIQA
jgi:hypothetical protein